MDHHLHCTVKCTLIYYQMHFAVSDQITKTGAHTNIQISLLVSSLLIIALEIDLLSKWILVPYNHHSLS